MRFAIAAVMTLLLVGTMTAQDAASAQDPSSPAASPTAASPTDQSPPAAMPSPDAQATVVVQPNTSFAFAGGVNLGSDVLLSGEGGSPETWTRLGFQPDLSFGKFGLGFDFTIHFMLYPNSGNSVKIYPGDWIPHGGLNYLDIYLPKFLYIRYGLKGSDPFFAKLGSIDDLSLGDGFIMSDYSNMHFLPQQRIFGFDLGLDGAVFGFPYVGVEAITGNLARVDVDGARVYARPFAWTSIPILEHLQIGGSFVADMNPDLYASTLTRAKPIAAYGADLMVPLVVGQAFPLQVFTDVAIDPNSTMGSMVGFAGRLFSVFTYGAQVRIMQNEFIPSYFDANYDIYRAQKYDAMQRTPLSGNYLGWYATVGTSLISDKVVFSVELDGPFSASGAFAPTATQPVPDQTKYPHLRTVLRLAQLGTFPFYFDASYEKYDVGAIYGFFKDLSDPTDAVVGLDVNYKTGASVITLVYDAKWDPASAKFEVTSGLQASVQF